MENKIKVLQCYVYFGIAIEKVMRICSTNGIRHEKTYFNVFVPFTDNQKVQYFCSLSHAKEYIDHIVERHYGVSEVAHDQTI